VTNERDIHNELPGEVAARGLGLGCMLGTDTHSKPISYLEVTLVKVKPTHIRVRYEDKTHPRLMWRLGAGK